MHMYFPYAKILIVPSPTSCDTSWLCDLGHATHFQILGMMTTFSKGCKRIKLDNKCEVLGEYTAHSAQHMLPNIIGYY